ncbi:MAG: trypsin-like peptidase domain-containing protein [Taibaiella sp.]|nr:trypsin-like peptidase domain-containing protein [Taibaiella sp.]
MSIQETIERYQNSVVQIASKSGTGTGFYLLDYDLIVTNHHVVGDNRKVTVKGKTFDKKLASVVFTDARYDLAFLMPPVDMHQLPELMIGDYDTLKDGDSVVAIGHPYGLNYTATQGVISRVERVQQGIKYIQIDAAINPGNSGGPLINENGKVVGVNTFIIKGGDNLGFALPSSYVKEALEQYKPLWGTVAIRCPTCGTIVTEQTLENGKYCPTCGTEIDFPKKDVPEENAVSGIARTIEGVLLKLGYDHELARNGRNRWEVANGTTKIKISYNPESFFIISDAFLCLLPKHNIKELYTYLLQENYKLRNKLFSIHGDNIVLSCLLLDLDMSTNTGEAMFRDLFVRATEYQQVLMTQFECQPILEEH